MKGRKQLNNASFRLKTRHKGLKIAFMAVYVLMLGLYVYHGFQPFQVGASAPERLFIPSINLSTPVDSVTKNGASLEVPEVIAGAYSENTNKTLLIGHSNTVFTRLKDLKIGSNITFDSQTYRIRTITTQPKTEIDMTEILGPADTPTLILMTCSGQHIRGHDYTHRLVITAELQNV